MTVALNPVPDGLCLEFADDGAPFNPIVAPAKRIERRCEDFEIGGYGTGLLQKFTRRMSYRRKSGRNILALEFAAIADSGGVPAT